MTTRRLTLMALCLAASTAAAAAQSKPARKPAAAPTAATHKAWMNEATDAQEDLREALAAKSSAKVAIAALKLQTLMTRTERYWTSRHADDIVKLAVDAKSLAGAVAQAARARKLDQAAEAFGKLNTTCNTCHDRHSEKR